MKRNNNILAGILAMLLFFTAMPLGDFIFAKEGEEHTFEDETPLGEEIVSEDEISEGEEPAFEDKVSEMEESVPEDHTSDVEEAVPEDETSEVEEAVPEDDTPPGENGDIFVEKVTLRDADGNVAAGEVSLSKRYWLRYDLISPLQMRINETDVMQPPYMEKGVKYLLPGITDDFYYFTGSIAVKANDGNGNIITVATVELGADGIPIFLVDAGLDKGRLLDGYFEVEVCISQEKIGDAEDYTFTLPKGGNMEAEIEENKKLPPVITKEAAGYDPDNQTITWHIVVQNAAKVREDLYPLMVSDVIGDGQTYVEGSFCVIEPAGLEPEQFEASGRLMTWQCGFQEGNATIRYEYQTRVDVLALLESELTGDDISLSVQNQLSVTGADGSDLADGITAVQPITEKVPVEIVKSGGETIIYHEEDDTAEVTWTITVRNNGCTIEDLTVYDYFDAGAALVRLKGEPVCTPQPAGGRGFDPSGGITNGRQYRWSYHIGAVSGNTTYTIAYTTVIEDYSEYLKKNNRTKPGNRAWFDFQYPLEDGTGSKKFLGSVVNAYVEGISANIIEKTGVYDPSTHQITWTIVVNPNQIELPDAFVTDKIPAGQRYVSSDVVISDHVVFTITEDKKNNTVTFHFGEDGLSGRTAVITLVTELEDSESDKWASNWSGSLQNEVTLYAGGLAEGGVTDIGTTIAKSVVIKKEMGVFDYADHTIPITVTVNQNNMKLTGAVITDRLTEYGLLLVEEAGVQIDGISLQEGTADRPSYTYDGGTLTIYPGEELTEEIKITFTAQAADSYINAHRTETMINFENIAALTSDQYGEEVRAKDTVAMGNSPIVKHGTLDKRTCNIVYTVEFNRTLADLPEGLVLTDTLPDGLQLLQPTIGLWVAEVDSRTGAMTSTGRRAVGYSSQVSIQGENTILQISIPKGKQAYILTYSAQIVDKEKAPFVNRVEVTGYPEVKDGRVSFGPEQVAGARLEDLIHVRVRKVDVSGEPLAGAVFALRQGEEQLLMGATGEDGYVSFVGVDAETEYTVVELQAPEGYVTSAREWRFTTGEKGGVEYASEQTFVNREKTNDKSDNLGGNREAPDFEEDSETDTGRGNNKMPEIMEAEPQESDIEDAATGGSYMGSSQDADRLPQTGGFWGSGIMYLIGVFLIGVGIVLHCSRGNTKKIGRILLVMGGFLIISTLLLNLHAKWQSDREVSSFEAELTLTDPATDLDGAMSGVPQKGETQEPDRAMEEQNANGVLAVLSIPAISCREPVKEGSGREILAKALGHVEGTALPGQTGNCVIAGHRNYTFGLYFNRLSEVTVGDEITVSTKEGVYTYRIVEIRTVEPEDLSVLEQTREPRLTLITCTPIYIASHRLIVVAELIR